MSMREAFDNYFYKLNEYWKEKGKYPKTVYMKECDVKGGIYLPNTIDEFGYVQWQPVLQKQSVDFAQLESELGFKIHKSIKEFHSIYWFERIECLFSGRNNMWLDGVLPYNVCSPEAVLKNLKNGFDNCMEDYLNDDIYFEIGGADSDGIYVNNTTGKVFIADVYEQVRFDLANSIESLLNLFGGKNE